MLVPEIIQKLHEESSPAYLAGMTRFGIDNAKAIGVPVPVLRKLSKSIKTNQNLSLDLWETGIHEARLLATMIGDPAKVTSQQMDNWVKDFTSWDICDQACGNLFDRTTFALERAAYYTLSEQEYVKRAGFVLMAEFAVHNKKASNESFIALLPLMEHEAWDERNFVKKAVNWALRQIGKRNPELRKAAIETANRIMQQNTKAAKWIASDALKELNKKIL
jgi:3-methyladenine DNA glycosylase AlkD